MKMSSKSRIWYEGGLRFACRQCGSCCAGDPGYVFLQWGEWEEMADFLGMGEEAFLKTYTRKARGRRSLLEEKDGLCVFLTGGECRIYAVRPRQCRTFPFWEWNLSRRDNWVMAAEECPGMGKGKLHSRKEIEKKLKGRWG